MKKCVWGGGAEGPNVRLSPSLIQDYFYLKRSEILPKILLQTFHKFPETAYIMAENNNSAQMK